MKTFWTKEQIEYARSVAKRRVIEAVRQDLKGLEFEHKTSGGLAIGISMTFKPGGPVSLAWYREKNLETEANCKNGVSSYEIASVVSAK